jgi:hypothetical protein
MSLRVKAAVEASPAACPVYPKSGLSGDHAGGQLWANSRDPSETAN